MDDAIISNIIDAISGSLYWKNKNGTYLGCNMLGAELAMLSSPEEIIGKTDFQLFPHKVAKHFRKNDLEVMRLEKELSFEEECVLSGKRIVLLSYKKPLYNKDHRVIGIVGNSIDITDRKRAERLQIEKDRLQVENEVNKTLIVEQEKFKKVVEQVVHDIRSPLASLLMILKSCNDIPEPARLALRSVSVSIGDIANNLFCQYKREDGEHAADGEEQRPILVSLILLQILIDKKYQYQSLPIKFTLNEFSNNDSFAFIKAQPTAFKRMLSNLINNAVEAMQNKTGNISIKLVTNEKSLKVIMEDNGRGIAPKILEKIKNNMKVTSGKKNGHGIGLIQVWETVANNGGEIDFATEVGKGTKITLTFPRIDSPGWIANEITVKKGDTVVIIDDDASIHSAWKERFKTYAPHIKMRHFTQGDGAMDFVMKSKAKDDIFLLADFELLKQGMNGIDVIEKAKFQERSILVTSHYSNPTVLDLAIKSKIKILPKELASEISINFIKKQMKLKQIPRPKVDLVLIDDSKMFTDAMSLLLGYNDRIIETYNDPQKFLNDLDKYDKNTKICTDHDLHSHINGIELSKYLHTAGFKNLYLLSGWDFTNDEIPAYLTVISKTDTEAIKKLV